MAVKTLDEVRNRYNQKLADGKFLDFSTEVLGVYLVEGQEKLLNEKFVTEELLSYLNFAFGKAIEHRGISASRSVQKLTEWAWILGLDDLVEFAQDDSNYPNYGVPVLKKFAQHFNVIPPEEIVRWPDGEPCGSSCTQGCGK